MIKLRKTGIGYQLIQIGAEAISPLTTRLLSTVSHTDTLDELVSHISNVLKKSGRSKTDLLLIHNPVSFHVVDVCRKAIQCRVAVSVDQKYPAKQLTGADSAAIPVHHVNLLKFHKLEKETVASKLEQEEKIILDADNPEGLVVLASFVSDKKETNAFTYLTNRVLTRDNSTAFHRLRNLDWFCLLSESNYRVLSNSVNIREVRLHKTFYKHELCFKMKLGDSRSIFYHRGWRMNGKKSLSGSPDPQADVYVVHFTPKRKALKSLNLENREKYQTFTKLLQGNKRLIPALEQWVPGCGKPLVDLGYGMADEIFTVSPSKFLQLYKDVLKLPEFDGSALQSALASRKSDSLSDLDYMSKLF